MEECIRGLAGRGYEPRCVFDIGAAEGSWTRMAWQFWPKSRYLLVEPLEEWRPALEGLRKEADGIEYVIAGAGDCPARLGLGVTKANLHISSFAYSGALRREVEVTTVDLLARKYGTPDFLKVDVQGFERRVIEGAREVLESCSMVLLELQFIRFAPEMTLLHEGLTFMAERGFVAYEIFDCLRRPLDGAMGQCDVLFVRADHWLLSNNQWG